MFHAFEESLQSEPDPLVCADQFYQNVLNATDINRYDSEPEFDAEFKRMGIDVSFVMDDKTIYVAEYFRKNADGHFYMEVFRNYPNEDGWIYTGSPDYITYFADDKVYMIQFKSLREFYEDKLLPLLPEDIYEDFSESRKKIISEEVELDDDDEVEIHLIKTPDLEDVGACDIIGISVPIRMLEKYGVKIKTYEQ